MTSTTTDMNLMLEPPEPFPEPGPPPIPKPHPEPEPEPSPDPPPTNPIPAIPPGTTRKIHLLPQRYSCGGSAHFPNKQPLVENVPVVTPDEAFNLHPS
jgi:hypothetical protein